MNDFIEQTVGYEIEQLNPPNNSNLSTITFTQTYYDDGDIDNDSNSDSFFNEIRFRFFALPDSFEDIQKIEQVLNNKPDEYYVLLFEQKNDALCLQEHIKEGKQYLSYL